MRAAMSLRGMFRMGWRTNRLSLLAGMYVIVGIVLSAYRFSHARWPGLVFSFRRVGMNAASI
jgi:hypothetical protein